jgi:pyruvate formate lyase activating enzyme
MKVNGYSHAVKRPILFDVQRYSTHDGPGIRTVVFLKGCPLRCEWCSNPESQSVGLEILFEATRCVGCRACLRPEFGGAMHEVEGKIVPDRSKPVPRELAGVCPSLALRIAGREVEAEALVHEVLKDKAFFDKSGGGVTFSGGEPLDQPEFLLECVQRLEMVGVSVAIESCLAVEASALLPFLGHNIHWLVDVKHLDADKLAAKTAGDAPSILANLRLLASREVQVTYRVPLIPGFNDSDVDRDAILGFIALLERPPTARVRVDVLPYHDLAAGKYQQLGRPNPYTRERIAQPTLEGWKNAAANRGIELSWGG